MVTMPRTIPEGLLPDGMEAYIAGGYAACPELAKDMDVWVVGRIDPEQTRDEILAHLQKEEYSFVAEDSTDQSLDGIGYDEMPIVIRKVATVAEELPLGVPIHIMVTDAPSICAVLSCFDISTHQVGFDEDGDQIQGPDWTPIEAPPVQLRETPSTLARMKRITKRYAHLRQEVMSGKTI